MPGFDGVLDLAQQTMTRNPAASRDFLYFGTDGLPYYRTSGGTDIPFTVGATAGALHLNSDFETYGPPVANWDNFWQAGGCTTATETTDVLFGSRSYTVNITAGGGNNQLVMSSAWTCNPGDTVTVGIWARKVSGNPQFTLGIMTGPSGTPAPFDGTSYNTTSDLYVLNAAFTKYTNTFTVPQGHAACRLIFRTSTTDAAAGVARFDSSTSSKSAGSLLTLPSNSWPKEAVKCVDVSTAAPATAAPNSVDGYTVAVGDRVLKADPAAPATNGIYTVTTVGTGANGVWARAADASTNTGIAAAEVTAGQGTLYGGTRWATTFKSTDVIGTTGMAWTQQFNDTLDYITATITSVFNITTTNQTVPFATKINGSASMTIDGSGQVVVGKAGVYHVNLQLEARLTSTGYVYWKLNHIRGGGTLTTREAVESTAAYHGASITAEYDCQAGDVFQVQVVGQNSAGGDTMELLRNNLSLHRLAGPGPAGPPGPSLSDSGWISVAFAANWGNYGSGWAPVQYRKLGNVVYLRGLGIRATSTSVADETMFTVGAAYCPPSAAGNLIFACDVGVHARMNVKTTGTVSCQSALAVGAYIAYNGITWTVD